MHPIVRKVMYILIGFFVAFIVLNAIDGETVGAVSNLFGDNDKDSVAGEAAFAVAQKGSTLPYEGAVFSAIIFLLAILVGSQFYVEYERNKGYKKKLPREHHKQKK